MKPLNNFKVIANYYMLGLKSNSLLLNVRFKKQ